MDKRGVNDVIRFGIIGCGRIAQSHLQALATLPDAKLTVAVESRAPAGEAVAAEFKCKWVTDYANPEILSQVDAVIIAAPPNLHGAIARYFLEKKIHVLCEKPLTITSSEARELVALSKDKGALLMMASKFRYVDDLIKAKAIIESGILGKVILYENIFCSKVPMGDRWNAKKDVAGGGVLIDNGCHSADIARYLLGPIAEVQATTAVGTQNLAVEETVRVQFQTKSGVLGSFDLSWSVTKESKNYVQVFGSEGTLQVGWKGSRYSQSGSSTWVPFGTGYDKVKAFGNQHLNFIACMKGLDKPLISAEDSMASVQVVEAAYRSIAQRNWQPVDQKP